MWRNWGIGLLLLFVFRLELFSQTEVLFSHSGGFYDEPFTLSLGCSDWECQVRYTTNGDTPTSASALYETPLFLDERLYSTSDIYTLPIAPVFEPFVPDSVQHAIVIRAAAFDDQGQCVSEVKTNTYLIRALGCNHHGLPVASVCCDSLSLFDFNIGILVPGVNFDPENPKYTGNYYQRGREWERLANLEFYEPEDNSSINQQCGVRAHGNRARKAAAKGLKFYAREEYGKKRFKHHFFETTSISSFKHLVLKPFSTLWPYVGVQDYVDNRLALEIGLEAPHSRPVVVYLNGEYWGIYFLQEKLDDHYIEDHFGVEPERCNIIGGNGIQNYPGDWNIEVESGNGDAFVQMLDWLEDADCSDEVNYADLNGLIEVDNFIDYQILEMFIANDDWPANNFRCWQADDSKWRFVFFDGDASLMDTTYDAFWGATYVALDRWHTGGKSTLMFRRLLENNDFKQKYIRRSEELCNTVLRYDNTVLFLDEVEQALSLEIPSQKARFGYPVSMEHWRWGCSLVRTFLRNRADAFREERDGFEPLKEHDYQPNTDDFVIYPNPVEDEVHIKMLDGRSRATEFVLCDITGRVIKGGMCYLSACQEVVLNLELRAGVYVVKIGPYAYKFVKM